MGEEKQFHPQIVVLEWRKIPPINNYVSRIMLAELAAAEIAKIAFEAVNALLGLSEIPDRIQIRKPLLDKRMLTFFLIKTQISGFC
ncbi:hypothetical protein [Microcystis aeruginosa]|uniref:Uncharacterized protein n=1 Tax=Microcystis aeruginosa Ma_QC_C_20070703_M131 TaxID=2486263 RepID=A0A551XRR0_MICAE|nr:hypothetical protein [Microcystis aeruginosa]MDB9393182.1 hypothetical protein [Microcystis aeruginosa CS-579]TRT51408.1 MAG: hypothetical protein EWV85_15490 [Microcystis aeruginosa Ma_QC_C_20070703_M131]